MKKPDSKSIERISVIVPSNPFVQAELQQRRHCLCALDVTKLMLWWPGTPHSPHRDAGKVKAIQRSLDWKRVAHIASYLLQEEITRVPERIDQFFSDIYEPKKNEFPTFSNILLHVNGAEITPTGQDPDDGPANLTFDEDSNELKFSVIDG